MRHPDDLLSSLTARQLQDWLDYAREEPFGSTADDIRLGGIQAALYNVNRDPKRNPQPFSAAEMFSWTAARLPKPADATPEEQLAAFDRLFG